MERSSSQAPEKTMGSPSPALSTNNSMPLVFNFIETQLLLLPVMSISNLSSQIVCAMPISGEFVKRI